MSFNKLGLNSNKILAIYLVFFAGLYEIEKNYKWDLNKINTSSFGIKSAVFNLLDGRKVQKSDNKIWSNRQIYKGFA